MPREVQPWKRSNLLSPTKSPPALCCFSPHGDTNRPQEWASVCRTLCNLKVNEPLPSECRCRKYHFFKIIFGNNRGVKYGWGKIKPLGRAGRSSGSWLLSILVLHLIYQLYCWAGHRFPLHPKNTLFNFWVGQAKRWLGTIPCRGKEWVSLVGQSKPQLPPFPWALHPAVWLRLSWQKSPLQLRGSATLL